LRFIFIHHFIKKNMNPSLLLIPDRYKAAKLYSQIPDSGAGDLTFARNSNATRVNSAGLIEKVRTNVILQSQAFETASWSSSFAGTGIAPVITANNATAPDGSMTADTIVFDAGAGTTSSDSSGIFQVITANGLFCGSFFARVASGTGQLMCRHVGGSSYTTLNLTTTWQRFSVVETGSTGFFEITIRRGLNEPINASVTAQLWGAQLEAGDIATPYIPTLGAAVSVGITADIPRLDYTGGGCPSLLLEPQRTNLTNFSEQFDNAYWIGTEITITANSVTSPDGYTNADTFTETVTNATHSKASATISFTSGTTYTFSAFAKNAPGGRGFVQLYGFNLGAGAADVFANFDINTGVVGTLSGGTSTITNYGNGWYRCTFTFTCGNSLSERINLVNVNSASATAGQAYAGDITKAIYWYGAQVEEGSYVSSYIPTLGSSVTRLADSGTTSIPTLVNASEGVLFLDYKVLNVVDAFPIDFQLQFDGGNSVNGVTIFHANNIPAISVRSNSTTSFSASLTSTSVGSQNKIAVAYKANDFAVYQNGVQIAVQASGAAPLALNEIRISDGSRNFSINASAVYTTRLSNADLQTLTSL
jgi:hypothetical protein